MHDGCPHITTRGVPMHLVHRAAGLGLAGALTLGAAPAALPAASAASGVPCHASMSDSTPKDYTYVYVRVSTAARAYVHTVAHYKTTNTSKSGRASSSGHASLAYYILSATPGY